MRAGRTLRRIILARIAAQVPALGGRVYDKATEGTQYPYVTLGPSYWNDESLDCIEARSIVVQIDAWDSARNKGALEDLTDDIAAALNGWSDELALTMHPLRIISAQVQDDPNGQDVHGIVRVEAMVESDG